MTYSARDVKDRAIQFASRYKLTDISTGAILGTFDLEQITGIMYEEGTFVNKAYLQPIENELANLSLNKAENSSVEKLTQELMETNRKLMTVGAISSLKDMPDYAVYDFLDSTDQDTGTTATYDSTNKKYTFGSTRQLLKIKDDTMDTFNTLGVRIYNSALTKAKVVNSVTNSNQLTVESSNYQLTAGDKLLLTEAATGLPKVCTIQSFTGGTIEYSQTSYESVPNQRIITFQRSHSPIHCIAPSGRHYQLRYSTTGSNLEVLRKANNDATFSLLFTVLDVPSYPNNNKYGICFDVDANEKLHIFFLAYNGITNYLAPVYRRYDGVTAQIEQGVVLPLTIESTVTNQVGKSQMIVKDTNNVCLLACAEAAPYKWYGMYTINGGANWANLSSSYLSVNGANATMMRINSSVVTRSGKILLKGTGEGTYLKTLYYASFEHLIAPQAEGRGIGYTHNATSDYYDSYVQAQVLVEHPTINDLLCAVAYTNGATHPRIYKFLLGTGVSGTGISEFSSNNLINFGGGSVGNREVLMHFGLYNGNLSLYVYAKDQSIAEVIMHSVYTLSSDGLSITTVTTAVSLGVTAGNQGSLLRSNLTYCSPKGICIIYAANNDYLFRFNYIIGSAFVLTLDTAVTESANAQKLITSQYIVKQNGTELPFKEIATAWGQEYAEYQGAVPSTSIAKVSVDGKSTQAEALAYYNSVA